MHKLDRNNTNFTTQLYENFKHITHENKYSFLKYYQNLVRDFMMNVQLDSRGLLIAHSMGLGKSMLAIAIAIDMIKERQPILLLTKSLQGNMRNTIKKYINMRTAVEPDFYLGHLGDELDAWINKNFSFVSMNASNMLKQMNKAAEGHSTEELDAMLEKKFGEVLKMSSLDGKLLIIDEAHNFFRAITNGSKNAIGVYDMAMKAKNLKLLFLTGTPVANDPFETVPCFNMLGSTRGIPILPEHYHDFNKMFVDIKHGRIKNRDKFQNRLFGLVSYVDHNSTPGAGISDSVTNSASKSEFPTQLPIITEQVNMDSDQYVIYQLARDKEKEEGGKYFSDRHYDMPSMTKPKGKASSTYRVRSRQLSNFCAPTGLREEKDPRKIPQSSLGSAKYRRIVANIDKHQNQLGIAYSQFVGVGGLGTFARYLDSLGWEEYKIPRGNNKQNDSNDLTFEGGIDGPSIPSAYDYINHIEKTVSGSSDYHHKWWLSADDNTANNDLSDIEINIIDESSDADSIDDHIEAQHTDLNIHDIFADNIEPSLNIEFRYAVSEDNIATLNPAYIRDPNNIKYPNYILEIYENGAITGYAQIEYDISTHKENNDSVNYCAGRIVQLYLDKVSAESEPLIMRKIISDAIKCPVDPAIFKRQIWGNAQSIRRYALITGDISVEDRLLIQDIFNSEANKHGEIIALLLISSTGAEGLDLKNVRHIHIIEPYWNWGRIEQIIFRGVRNDSHIALPADEKNVQPYIYIAIPPATEKLSNGLYPETTDSELYHESIANQALIISFINAIREVSIECMANADKNCRICNPTNQQLFTDNIEKDIRSIDNCTALQEKQIRAEEIIVDDIVYYFAANSQSIYDYDVFIHDEKINGYRVMSEDDPRHAGIIAAIRSR